MNSGFLSSDARMHEARANDVAMPYMDHCLHFGSGIASADMPIDRYFGTIIVSSPDTNEFTNICRKSKSRIMEYTSGIDKAPTKMLCCRLEKNASCKPLAPCSGCKALGANQTAAPV